MVQEGTIRRSLTNSYIMTAQVGIVVKNDENYENYKNNIISFVTIALYELSLYWL